MTQIYLFPSKWQIAWSYLYWLRNKFHWVKLEDHSQQFAQFMTLKDLCLQKVVPVVYTKDAALFTQVTIMALHPSFISFYGYLLLIPANTQINTQANIINMGN